MIPIRIRIVVLIALGTIINYLDRINISVAGPQIMEETGWGKAEWGTVLSIFLVGYALFQYPGGALSDRWGPRKVIGFSCIGFSLFTALTPLGQSAMILLLAMRFMVGACESMSFPSFASMNSRWIPRSEFARAQAVLLSGACLPHYDLDNCQLLLANGFLCQCFCRVDLGRALALVHKG